MKEINGYLSLAGGNDVKKDKGSFNRPPRIDSLLSSSFDPFVRVVTILGIQAGIHHHKIHYKDM